MSKSKIVDFKRGEFSSLSKDFQAEGAGLRDTLYLEAWPRLSRESNWLRPQTVCVLAGPPGRGKSLFLLEALIRLQFDNVTWRLLPLEDTAADVYRRALAIVAEDWSVIDTNQHGADRRLDRAGEFLEFLSDVQESVFENPRLPVGEPGKRVVPPLPYPDVLKWIADQVKAARVVAVDPLAQIDWIGQRSWEAQADFVRKAVGIAASSNSTVILVAHSAKRPGKASAVQLSSEDVQGAAELSRLAHCVLLWEGIEDKESHVWRPDGPPELVTHNRTMTIGKARYGRGGGSAIAFSTYAENRPGYREMGSIVKVVKEPK